MKQTLQLNNPEWGIPLPRPNDPAIKHEPRVERIHEVNPAYLSDWNPDAGDRAMFFLLAAGCGLIPSALQAFFLLVDMVRTGSVRAGAPMDAVDIGVAVFFGLLPVLCGVGAYLLTRVPLRPATYLSRTLRRVYGWHGNKKIDGGWVSIDWDKVVPVARCVRTAPKYGSEKRYVLQLLEADPKNKAVLKFISVFDVQDSPEQCGEMWEYLRRYMNGAPEHLPPARLRWLPGFWGLVIQLHEKVFLSSSRPEEAARPNPIEFVLDAIGALGIYALVAIDVWLAHIIPRQQTPAELTQANCWTGQNPYPIQGASAEEQAQLKRRAMRILPFDAVLMTISVLFYLGIVAFFVYFVSADLTGGSHGR